MSEVIILGIGQAGNRIADKIWELFCIEHKLNPQQPTQINPTLHNNPFFQELSSGKYCPRSLFIDLDPAMIDQVKKGPNRHLYNPAQMISGKQDTSSNFIRGQCTIGRQISERSQDILRKMIQKCESFQGFVLGHSIGGGTGSGFTSLLSDRINVSYPKKLKIAASVYPQGSTLSSIVEPYNAILSTQFMIDRIDLNVLVQNNNLTDKIQRQLDIEKPSLSEVNKQIAKIMASVTSGVRFPGTFNSSLRDLVVSMQPYPRIHNTMSAYVEASPLMANRMSTQQLTNLAFSRRYSPFPQQGVHMATSLLYRGNTNHAEVVNSINELKNNKSILFADWVPTGFRVGVNGGMSKNFEGEPINSTCALFNNSAARHHYQKLSLKFDKLYARRAFVHWYVGEGLDQGFFSQARQNFAAFEKDHQNIQPIQYLYDEEDFNGVQ